MTCSATNVDNHRTIQLRCNDVLATTCLAIEGYNCKLRLLYVNLKNAINKRNNSKNIKDTYTYN